MGKSHSTYLLIAYHFIPPVRKRVTMPQWKSEKKNSLYISRVSLNCTLVIGNNNHLYSAFLPKDTKCYCFLLLLLFFFFTMAGNRHSTFASFARFFNWSSTHCTPYRRKLDWNISHMTSPRCARINEANWDLVSDQAAQQEYLIFQSG